MNIRAGTSFKVSLMQICLKIIAHTRDKSLTCSSKHAKKGKFDVRKFGRLYTVVPVECFLPCQNLLGYTNIFSRHISLVVPKKKALGNF